MDISALDAIIKMRFAALSARSPENNFVHVQKLLPDLPGAQQYQLCVALMNDPEVKAEIARQLNEVEDESLLPSKTTFALELLDTARSMKSLDPENAHKFYKLYADVRGMIDKPVAIQNNTNVTVNRVMVQERHGQSTEDWERIVAGQQRALTLDADNDRDTSNNGSIQ